MNCKPGMAVMVKWSSCGNEGRVGIVVEPIRESQFLPSGRLARADGWRVDGTFIEPMTPPLGFGYFLDEQLIPLPGGAGEDETLQWAPVPGETTKVQDEVTA